jgi:hypothetical protein
VPKFRINVMIAAGVLTALCYSSVSRGEDGIPDRFNIDCGGNCAHVLATTSSNTLLSATPGGTFVVTVAHLAPSPEDAMDGRVPAKCKPVDFRIDMLNVKTQEGVIEVELGEQKTLGAGEASQIIYKVDPNSGAGLPTYELDMMGFRFRSQPASSRCGVTASGLFYPDPSTSRPIPFGLIATAGPSYPEPGPPTRR